MTARKMRWLVPFVAVAVLLFVGPAAAQEHPKGKEHPQGKEHPVKEHPKGEAGGLTKDDIADAITSWVNAESAKGGGSLMVDDPVEKKKLSLTLDKVHREKLAQISSDVYFACADFKASDGTKYDLDVFMKGPDKNNLQTTEVSVHKKNGQERYTWMEEGGMWKKVEKGGHEHPDKEHPAGKEHPKGKEHPNGR